MAETVDRLWSVRGVPDDVRGIASDAAKTAGVPIGQWVSHAIRQTALSDSGGRHGEVLSDRPSDAAPVPASDRPGLDVIQALLSGLGQIADKKGCGGLAEDLRAVIRHGLADLSDAPLPKRRAPPRTKQITSEIAPSR